MMSSNLFPFHMSVLNETMYNPGNRMVIILGTNDTGTGDGSNLHVNYNSSGFYCLVGKIFFLPYTEEKNTLNKVKDVFDNGC